ncbi:MAG: zinc-binding dehydrogenase [Candidatus Omnitrophica bacterium]|nr:zinc-binding dehydrogenase [Candidatus Omnitrophota bacterium]
MKAAILVEQKKPLVIADIDLPSELQYGQVLVKIACSSVCGSQIGEIDGVKGPDKFLPHLLGHEGGGIVSGIGPGVTKVKKDDHVVLHWRKGSGIEAPLPKYKWGNKTVNAGWVTTFSEYAVVSENRITAIDKDVDLEIAALMGCAVTTGLGIISNDVGLKMSESIAVFGAGGVGLNVIQGAALVSAGPIIAIDIHDDKLKLAKKFGASHVINSTKADPDKEIRKITGPRGADAAVDITGIVSVINQAYEVTSDSGRTILVGVPRKGEKISIYSLPLHFGKRISGSHGGGANPTVDIPRYLDLYKKGKLKFDGMITDRYGLDDINDAIDGMRKGRSVKCIIKM